MSNVHTVPVLVWANWYHFRPGETVRHKQVESVCVLWSARGQGQVRCRGQAFWLGPGDVLVLPWSHDIQYEADFHLPFQLGTLHVVPAYSGAPENFAIGVGLEAGDGLFGLPQRADDLHSKLGQPLKYEAASRRARNLIQLGSYAIQQFQTSEIHGPTLAALGQLIYAETGALEVAKDEETPHAVQAMKEFMLQNLARPIAAGDVARAALCSPSSAARIFLRHEGMTPKAWLTRARLQQAALLLQATNLQVKEVAFQVGFHDSLYFSKVFRAAHGVPPSRYQS
jgi:AraC-like DNA-binding protein